MNTVLALGTVRRAAVIAASALVTSGIALLAASPALAAGPPDPDCSAATTCSVTYGYVGEPQTFTVPADVTSVRVVLSGASGGGAANAGKGGRTTGTLSVTGGEVFTVVSGQAGRNGDTAGSYGGGGAVKPGSTSASGGGGSFLFDDSGSLLLAAGGGGGQTSQGSSGGPGGGLSGGQGGVYVNNGVYDNTPATGGSQSAAGTHGVFGYTGVGPQGVQGTDGAGPTTGPAAFGRGGDGGTLASYEYGGGGGGGGGYYGGGGGGSWGQAGGGGSAFAASTVSDVTLESGVRSGDGQVVISWDRVATTTTLSASPESGANSDTSVTLTATVSAASGGTPTGTMAFKDGTSTISGCGAVTLAGDGVATCTTTLPAGTRSLTATYSGSSVHATSASSPLSYSVLSRPSIETTALPEGTYGAAYTQQVSATGGSTPYAFSMADGSTLPGGLALAEDGTLSGTPTTVGSTTFTVVVTDADDDTDSQQLTLVVGKGSSALSIDSAAPAAAVVGETYTPALSASDSTGALSLVLQPDVAACAVEGLTLTFVHPGTCAFTAQREADDNVEGATSDVQSFEVGVGEQTVAFTFSPEGGAVVGGAYSITDHTQGDSASPVVFGATGACTVSGTTVSFTSTGTCTVTADQAGDGDHAAADQVAHEVEVAKAPTTTTVTLKPSALVATVAVDPRSNLSPAGSVEFTVDGTSVGTAEVTDGKATVARVLPAGRHRVEASFLGSSELAGSEGVAERIAPTIVAQTSSARPRLRSGWYESPVRITFRCTDASAAITRCPAPVVVKSVGIRTVTRTTRAADGGTATVTIVVKLDRVAPHVRIGGVRNNGTYRTVPQATCVGNGGVSGLRSCTVRAQRYETPDPKVTRIVYRAVAVDGAGHVSRTSKKIRLVRR